MRRVAPALVCLALLVPLAARDCRAQEAHVSEAADDTSVIAPAPGDSLPGLKRAPADSIVAGGRGGTDTPPGGDVRALRGRGVASLGDALPGVRLTGTGWPGHRAALARGAVPAAFTVVALDWLPADDRVGGGLDLMSASVPAVDVLLVESGHDLSTVPAHTTAGVTFGSPEHPLGGRDPASAPWQQEGARWSVRVMPWREAPDSPFSGLTMVTGSFDRRLVAAEFGRRIVGGRSGVSGFFENEDGRAPIAGGRYDIGRLGASASLEVSGAWTARLAGIRTELTRSRPFPGLSPATAGRRQIRSDVGIHLGDGNYAFCLFHGQTWLEPDQVPGAVEEATDGIGVGVPLERFRGGAHLRLERRSTGGRLLEDGETAYAALCDVNASFDLGPERRIRLGAGFDRLDDDTCPVGSLTLSSSADGQGSWVVVASLGCRHPTAVERWLRAFPLAARDWSPAIVEGNRSLRPERVLVLSATWELAGMLSGFGTRAEIARVFDPIVLLQHTPDAAHPENADDAGARSVSAWASVARPGGAGAALTLDYVGVSDDGPLNANLPVPCLSLTGSAWLPWVLFKGYLKTRWEVSVEHERGLSRGVWDGLIENSRTRVGAAVVGSAGSARLFARVDDVLETDTARLPSASAGGTVVSAGFSWHFWD